MRKKLGIVIILLGAALLIAALLLFQWNRQEAETAGAASDEAMQAILSELQAVWETNHAAQAETPNETAAEPVQEETPNAAENQTDEKIILIDGYDYIGYLSIPALELQLPVMADWDYTRLKFAPCRQFGSAKTDNLVIAGHNYVTHFAYLYKLQLGDAISFTEMDGTVNSYTVAKIDVIDPTHVEQVQNSGYALVLYTCTYGGKSRTAIFCNRAETADS